MKTDVLTPQSVFMQPQRLMVPLFQRPYVWNKPLQWEPLWRDLVRVARRQLDVTTSGPPSPHFMGAVVLQQVENSTGSLQERTVIDGQQRLTTFQLLMSALHGELKRAGAQPAARRLARLVSNEEDFRDVAEDEFKVWPTNRDRQAYQAVMSAGSPVDYDRLGHQGSRLVQAHQYFAERAAEWLADGPGEAVQERALALERAVRELMQLVVIDLAANENAQEIFETLNARGTPLTSADLIKNFIFQRLMEAGEDVEGAYERYWRAFETGFWEKEVSSGRVPYQRSSMFLNHWLIAKTGEEIRAREVFGRFKQYADHDAGVPIIELLGQIHRASQVYRRLIEDSERATGPVDRVGLFAYRTGVLQSEVVKPLALYLLDPDQGPVPDDQLHRALGVTESWLVRRMLARVTSKSYTQVFADLITRVHEDGRARAGEVIEQFFASQSAANWYWPDDAEVTEALRMQPVYRKLSRGRLRMVLEAVEDHYRGWDRPGGSYSDERVARGKLAIEHIMPRRWSLHWPLPEQMVTAERDAYIDTLGNLTLLTGRLNSKVSNGPWTGTPSKREALQEHDVLFLNRRLLEAAGDRWAEEQIAARTAALTGLVLNVWPVPAGHQVTQRGQAASARVTVVDLVSAGLLHEGQELFPRSPAYPTATVLPDGALDVAGERFRTPSGAAKRSAGKPRAGWSWWRIGGYGSTLRLRDLAGQYHEQVDLEDEGLDVDLSEDEDLEAAG